jgi:hypothetical protein
MGQILKSLGSFLTKGKVVMKRIVRKECRLEVSLTELIKLFQKEKWLPQGDIDIGNYSIEKSSVDIYNSPVLVVKFNTEETQQED